MSAWIVVRECGLKGADSGASVPARFTDFAGVTARLPDVVDAVARFFDGVGRADTPRAALFGAAERFVGRPGFASFAGFSRFAPDARGRGGVSGTALFTREGFVLFVFFITLVFPGPVVNSHADRPFFVFSDPDIRQMESRNDGPSSSRGVRVKPDAVLQGGLAPSRRQEVTGPAGRPRLGCAGCSFLRPLRSGQPRADRLGAA